MQSRERCMRQQMRFMHRQMREIIRMTLSCVEEVDERHKELEKRVAALEARRIGRPPLAPVPCGARDGRRAIGGRPAKRASEHGNCG